MIHIEKERARKVIANELAALVLERDNLKQWVDDLLSNGYVNCVYCGYRYGPKGDTPVSMADTLKEHVERCPKHPMSALRTTIAEIEAERERTALQVPHNKELAEFSNRILEIIEKGRKL